MKLVTIAQMRELEAATVAAGSSEAQMIEEAGLAVAQEGWMLLGTLEGRKILALAGPGNNGGDALVAARHLSDWGAEVMVWLPRKRRDEALVDECRERELAIVQAEDDPAYHQLEAMTRGADLIIDGLLGIGRQRPIDPEEPIGVALKHLAATKTSYSPPKILAVDIPTGMDADTGAVDPLTVAADMSVTFGLPKVGMYQGDAEDVTGRVQVIDIGIPKEAQERIHLELLTSRWARQALPKRPASANKGTFGRVLVLGGSERYPGAPRLAATAAYRAGAGLVTIACPASLVPTIAAGIAEATWLPQQTPGGGLRGENAVALRNEWQSFTAAVIGPGLGDTQETRAMVWALLPDVTGLRGVVLDADALNALATFDDGPARVPANAVLTPHPGEMARLMQTTVEDVQSRRMAVAKDAAAKYGCTVVLKGAHSVIADAAGQAFLCPFANPLLASAGTGDVLAGMIGAYLGQGLDPFTAAALGTYLHAATGEALRLEYGDAGLLASDLANRLPRAVKEIVAP